MTHPLDVGSSKLKTFLLATTLAVALYALVGFFAVPPLVSHLLISNIRDSLQREATIDHVAANPFLLSLELRDFELRETTGETMLRFDRFHLDLQAESILSGALTFQEVGLEGALVNIAIDEAGQMNWLRLFDESDEDDPADPGETPEEPAALPALVFHELDLSQARIHFTDASAATPLHLGVIPLNLHVEELQIGVGPEAGDSPISLNLELEGGGQLEITGNVHHEPLRARLDIDLSGFRLEQLQPLLDDVTSVELQSGVLGMKGRLTYDPSAAPALGFSGRVDLSEFVLHDDIEGQDLLRLPNLALVGLEVQSAPLDIAIALVDLSDPYIRFAIGEDGTTNFERALIADVPKAGIEEETPGDDDASEMPKLLISEVAIERGSAWFEDLAIRPAFATALRELHGGIKGLSTEPGRRAAIRLDGETGPHAPASITGDFQVFGPEPFLDLEMIFRGLDLTAFTPYSGRFVGYEIERGRMDLDLRYALRGEQLKGSNVLLLDQLTLGDRIESPDALRLPIALGIALLKDAEGRIDLDLRIEGNVNDPEFSAAGILWQAFVNLLTKAVTRPFQFLASLSGGAGPPDEVGFEAGLSSLGAREATSLDSLAEALEMRPSLLIAVQGGASVAVDTRPLREQLLDDMLVELHLDGLGAGARDEIEFLTLDEHARALQSLHAQLILPTSGTQIMQGPAAPFDETEAERIERLQEELLAMTDVDDEDYLELAHRRADEVADYLIEVGGIDEGRVRFREPVIEDGSDVAPLVWLSLGAEP